MSPRRSKITRRDALSAMAGTALLPALSAFPIDQAAAKANLLGRAQATHYRFRLGAFEVTILHDGAVSMKGPYPLFGNDQFEEDVEDVAKRNFLPTKRFRLSYAPVIVNTGKTLLLFDSGNGDIRRPERGLLRKILASAGYSPGDVDIVVITHCHPDHIGGLMENGKPAFPNARYVIGAAEYDYWSPAALAEGNDPIARRAKLVQTHMVPLAEKTRFLKKEDTVVTGIHALESFGHTPGHLAFHIESQGKRLIIWGDAVVHPVISVQQPDWQLVADMDNETAIETRKKLLDMAVTERLAVTAYHFSFPALGFIEKAGEAHRFVPASYQFDL